MAYPTPDDGGSVTVTYTDLTDAATLFYQASSKITDLKTSLTTDANDLINEMSNMLDQSPDSLRRFFNQWHTAVGNLIDALDKVGSNLDTAAAGYQQTDTTVGSTFQGHHGHGNIQ